jgi:predicted metalloprotease
MNWRRPFGATLAITLALSACTAGTSKKASPPTTTSIVKSTGSTTTTQKQRTARPYDALMRQTIASLDRHWSKWLPDVYDTEYRRLKGGLYAYRSDSVTPECEGSRFPYILIRENAFYCPGDDLIAWDDEGLFPRLAKKHGDLLLSVVLAHEWGHAVQYRANLTYRLDTITAEQQADCFAGAWLADLDPKEPSEAKLASLRDKNLDEVLSGFVEFRDYVGLDQRFAGSHGTAFDRIRAFQEGYEIGPQKCAEYEDELPPLVGFAFRSLKERFRGGNLPFKELVPQIVSSLKGSDLGGNKVAIVDRTSADGKRVCSRPLRFSGTLAKAVSGCLDGDGSVTFNRAALNKWYDRFGDFAPATILALGWASVVHEKTFLETSAASDPPTTADPIFGESAAPEVTPKTAIASQKNSFAADCLAGTWASGLIDLDEPENSDLSPGDLDEAAQTLLALASDDPRPGRGFDRVRAYRLGLLGGNCSEE